MRDRFGDTMFDTCYHGVSKRRCSSGMSSGG